MSAVTVSEVTRKPQREEFGQTFEEHYELAYCTAYSITRSVEDAEDVVQAIFLQLLSRERPADMTKNPKGYFYRAAVNLSLKNVRSRKRQVLIGNSEQFEASTEVSDSDGKEEMDQRLWNAIGELGERAAQILILRHIHNCPLSEIAKTMGTTRSSVAVNLFRSRARLKRLIRASQSGEKL
jgi:RNA polymerase sigma-70 factor, ECF subfamily